MYMIERQLITVIILCYQNYNLLSRAVKSVLKQDYPRIELIIADDGSDFFNEAGLNLLIKENRSDNLERYKILRHKINQGTVKNLNRAVKEMSGNFYVTLGADDELYDNSVLSSYISVFDDQGEDLWWICGRVNMVTYDSRAYVKTLPQDVDVPVLQRRNAEELFSLWSRKGITSTPGMCFRAGIADLVGGYSEEYTYMEDWPLYLKLLRKGITPFYLGIYTVKYSMGGIVHQNTVNQSNTRKRFLEEKYHMFRTEVDPYLDKLTPHDKKEYSIYMDRWMDRVYTMEFLYGPSSYKDKLKMMFKDVRIIKWVLEIKYQRLKSRLMNATKGWRDLLVLGFVALIAQILLCDFKNVYFLCLNIASLLIYVSCFIIVSLRFVLLYGSKSVKFFRKYFNK